MGRDGESSREKLHTVTKLSNDKQMETEEKTSVVKRVSSTPPQPKSSIDSEFDSYTSDSESDIRRDKRRRRKKSARRRHTHSDSDSSESESDSKRERRMRMKKSRKPKKNSRRRESDSESESSESESDDDRKSRKKRKSSRRRYSDSESESESESDSDRDRRRRRKKRREKDRKKRKVGDDDDEKRGKGKKKVKREKDKKKKKKDKEKRGKTGAVTNSWGMYGIVRENDMWNKRPEFTAWLSEVKQVNLESLPNRDEKIMFKEYMEDFNTATFPSKKYYDLDAYHRRKMEKQMKKGFKKVTNTERIVFNDEEQRRQEIQQARDKEKEKEVIAKKEFMKSGMAEDMKEQRRLQEEMAYLFKIGNVEAATAIQRKLEPDVPL